MGKVKKAFIEGMPLRKTGSLFCKIFSPKRNWGRINKVYLATDRWIGYQFRKFYSHFVKVQPNAVLFYTFEDTYTCNPKYINEELEKRNANVKIYWSLKNPASMGEFRPDTKVIPLKKNSYELFRAAMSCKVIVTNSLMGDRNYLIPIKRNQVLIETWHGSLGLKTFGPKTYKSSKEWPRAMKKTAKKTSYLISNSQFEDDIYRTSYWPKTPILRFGHPRNDIFFGEGDERKDEWVVALKKKYKIKERDAHFVMYAPTFRDDHNFACYNLNFNALLDTLQQKYGGKWYLLLRYHPTVLQDQKTKNKIKGDNILNVTNYTDIQKLMVIADVAICDYSSWMFDYMLTRKPLFIYASDLESYKKEREFAYPIETTPFPIAKTNPDLIENINNFDNEKYLKDIDDFLADKQCMEDGQASKRCVDLILDIIAKAQAKKKK